MRDYVRGLLGPVGRKNGWQLAEYAGHATPDGLQRLLASCRWDPEDIRDDLQDYVAERLGCEGGVLIIDDTGLRFGQDLTQAQIGARLGLSQMHISRMLTRTLKTLRAELTIEE